MPQTGKSATTHHASPTVIHGARRQAATATASAATATKEAPATCHVAHVGYG